MDSRWLPIPDQMLFDSNDMTALMPLDLDDEYIFSGYTYPQPPDQVPLVSGFNCLVRIFLGFVALPADHLPSRSLQGVQHCELLSPTQRLYHTLCNMYERASHVLDDVPANLSGWHGGYGNDDQSQADADVSLSLRYRQLESMRANIHVTSLWARSRIFERLHALTSASTSDQLHQIQTALWIERQEHCERLFYVLYSVTQQNLEPNGIGLSFKIRQVAAPLLSCPFEEHTNISQRARIYIEGFVNLLTLLDKYSFQDTQLVVWRNLESQKRQPVQNLVGDHLN